MRLLGGATSTEILTPGPILGSIEAVPVQASESSASDQVAGRRFADFSWLRASVAVDAMMLGVAVVTAELGAARAGVPATPAVWLLVFSALVFSLLWAKKLYAWRFSLRVLDDARAIAIAVGVAGMAMVFVRDLFAPDPAAASQAIRLGVFALVYLIGGRALLSWSERDARRRGETLRPTLIVGAGHVGRLTARRLLGHPELGMKPVGFLDKDPLAAEAGPTPVPILGASWDLEDVVREQGVKQVIVTFSKAPHTVLLRLARQCEELGVEIAFVPRLFDRMTEHVRVEHVGGLPLLTAELADPKGYEFAIKHALDRLCAALLLLLLSPVLLVCAVAVAVSVGRPILFRQTRVGRDGKLFEILKFRSMRLATTTPSLAELAPDMAPGGVEGEDLRTPVGDFLRRSSFDELPQLINVLRGEMSLVGPRPERPEYVDVFGEAVARYNDRHRVRAGITGWSQVNGLRGKTSISERAELDNYYVQNWTLWLDFKILVATVAAVFQSYRSVE
jgi:exopolysaccharide biosynthesis polyprenyl glycosylphosphotransferase